MTKNKEKLLFLAIEEHDLLKISELLSDGVNPNIVQTEWPKFTTLQAAIEELEYGGSIDVLLKLLENGADVNSWDGYHDATPLLMAVFRGQRDVVKILLEAGADPNVRSSEGDSPLRWSVDQQDIDMATMLLSFGANRTINEIGQPRGLTSLGIAVEYINVPLIKLLLDNGADITIVDEFFGNALLHLPPLKDSNSRDWHMARKLIST